MGVTEEVEKSGLTPKSFIVGTIVTVFWACVYAQRGIAFTNNGLYGGVAINNQVGTAFTGGLGASIAVILILTLVNRIKPVFTKQEVALIALMPPLSIFWQGYRLSIHYNTTGIGMVIGFAEASRLAKVIDYIPAVFGPKDPSFWNSGWVQNAYSAVPWAGLLAGQLGWSIMWQLFSAFSAMFLVMLVRYIYVNIEYTTSPMIEMYTTMVESTQRADKGLQLTKNKLLLISLVIGFVHVFLHWGIGFLPPLWTGNLASRFPNRGYIPIGGTNVDIFWPRRDTLTTSGLIPWVPLYISLIPMEVSWMTLQTPDVLYGFLFGWFILYFLWPTLETSMGRNPAYTPGTSASTCVYRIWWLDPSGLVSLFIPMGLAIGLALYPIIRHRKTSMPVLTSLFKKPPENVEKESPLRYRYLWIGLLVSLVLWIATGVMTGAAVVPVTIYIVVGLLAVLGIGRMMAETGGYMGCMINVPYTTMMFGYFGAILVSAMGLMGTLNQTSFSTYWVIVNELGRNEGLIMAMVTATMTLAYFQVGERTKTDKKSTFRMLLYIVPLAVIAVLFSAYWWFAYVPTPITYYADQADYLLSFFETNARNIPTYQFTGNISASHVSAAGANMGLLLLGIAIAFIVPWLRLKAPWLRLSIAGIMFGTMFGYAWWFTAIVALLIKYLVIKVGGIKLYDEKLKPICIGLAAGGFLAVVIYYLIGGLICTTWSIFATGDWDLY